jgi:hypothetical protein
MSDQEFDDKKKSDNNSDKYEELAVKNIMRNYDNRKFIWDILEECGVYEDAFDSDPIQAARNAGIREAGLKIERRLKLHAPDEFIKMMKDNI